MFGMGEDPRGRTGFDNLALRHDDDLVAKLRRDAQIVRDEQEREVQTIAEIGKDIERLVPTAADAFAMTVVGEPFDERKAAGRALMKEILTLVQLQQEGEVVLAAIGGFDLVFEGERFGKGDGYRYATLLQRTVATQEIDLAVTVTPLGAISRLEHALDDFDGERERYRHRLQDAHKRLASYQSREGAAFAFAEELAEKRRQLREVDEALAAETRNDSEPGGAQAA